MAIKFIKTASNYYTCDAGITFPNSDWCFLIAYKINNSSGTNRQALFACSTVLDEATPKFTVRYNELSFSSDPGKGTVELTDGINPRTQLRTNNQLITGVWLLGLLQRSGPNKELWIAQFGNIPTLQATSSAALGAITLAAPSYVAWQNGRTYPLDAEIAYIAQGNFALNGAQRTALARGVSPYRVRQDWTRCLPMASPAATLRPLVGTESYTQTGSPTMVPSPFELF